jgi:hypothetical protein
MITVEIPSKKPVGNQGRRLGLFVRKRIIVQIKTNITSMARHLRRNKISTKKLGKGNRKAIQTRKVVSIEKQMNN